MKHPRSRSRSGFTVIELVSIIVVLCILMAISVHVYGVYQQSACSARNTANVGELVRATESFYLGGNSFTNIVPDGSQSVPVETISDQLVNAGYLYANPKITSTEILVKFYPDPAASTNGLPADADSGVLFFLPTKDD